ncbi:hypothetical protein AKJ16_DCAP18712 [Drosera capensis]
MDFKIKDLKRKWESGQERKSVKGLLKRAAGSVEWLQLQVKFQRGKSESGGRRGAGESAAIVIFQRRLNLSAPPVSSSVGARPPLSGHPPPPLHHAPPFPQSPPYQLSLEDYLCGIEGGMDSWKWWKTLGVASLSLFGNVVEKNKGTTDGSGLKEVKNTYDNVEDYLKTF